MINMDLVASIMSGMLALSLFTLHVISSPKKVNWMPVPAYIRGGFWFAGVAFMWRSVNLFTLATTPGDHIPVVGQINVEGLAALGTMSYSVTALAWWTFRHLALPDRGWDRLIWAAQEEKRDPSKIPVMLTKPQILDMARSQGIIVPEPVNVGSPAHH